MLLTLHSITIDQEKYFDNGFLSRQISPTMEHVSYNNIVSIHFIDALNP